MPEPPVDTRVTETTVEVRSYELDAFDHVNHSVFLNYLEYARYEALRQGGFPYEEMILRGWGVSVVRLEIDYLSQARLGDRLRMARALITAVWVDSTRRPMRLPSEVQAALGMS
jgi:acyl-CoA thioesterase FadM